MTTTVRNLFKLRPPLSHSEAAQPFVASPTRIVVGHLHRRDFAMTTFTQGAGPAKRFEIYTTDMPR